MKRQSISTALLIALACAILPVPADAQVSVQSVANSDIGNVVAAATGDSVYQVSASAGTIAKLSGNAVRLSTGTTRSLVTIFCGNPPPPATQGCKGRQVSIQIGANGATSGSARALTGFNILPVGFTIKSQSGTNPVTFVSTQNIGGNSSWTFYVGMDLPIAGNDSGLATGASSSGFYVWVCPGAKCTPSSAGGSSGLAVASVWRPISLTATNLLFGNITRPRSGNGSVSLSPSGSRTVAGIGAYGFPSPAPAAASYTVSGEGGQLISITIPASFVMTRSGGTGALTVTTQNDVVTSPALNSSLGNAGNYTFHVGGSFPFDSSTPLGAYSGTFNVIVQYN